MIRGKLRSANLPAKVTSQRGHDAKGRVNDEIKKYDGGEISML
jgi:hypothetical protein